MAKKLTPFPPRRVNQPDESTKSPARVTIQVASQQYAVDISCKLTEVRPQAARPTSQHHGLLVQTRYLRLRRVVALGDLIDGWRVCWLGGWDKGKVYFVVMVERMVPNGNMS